MTRLNPAAGYETNTAAAPLLGKRILVVEDDYVLATDLSRGLADLGATILGPAPTPFYALSLLGRRGADAAVLDVLLHGMDVFDVAAELVTRSIPIVFATACSVDDLPLVYRQYPVLQKPIEPKMLQAALGEALFVSETHKPTDAAGCSEPDDIQLMRAIVRALKLLHNPGD